MTLKINEDIASSAKSTFDDTVKYLKDTKIEDQGSGTMEGNYLYYQEKIDQDSFYFNPTTRIFSYPTLIYSYVGGAHGGFSYQSHNIDTLTGKEIVITDILKNNYEKTITDYIKSQITKAIKKGSEIKGCGNCENLDMDNSDFAYGWQSKISLRNFVLKGDGIYFLFNNYDLASYAETAGGQMIIVPKSFLKDSIKRDW